VRRCTWYWTGFRLILVHIGPSYQKCPQSMTASRSSFTKSGIMSLQVRFKRCLWLHHPRHSKPRSRGRAVNGTLPLLSTIMRSRQDWIFFGEARFEEGTAELTTRAWIARGPVWQSIESIEHPCQIHWKHRGHIALLNHQASAKQSGLPQSSAASLASSRADLPERHMEKAPFAESSQDHREAMSLLSLGMCCMHLCE